MPIEAVEVVGRRGVEAQVEVRETREAAAAALSSVEGDEAAERVRGEERAVVADEEAEEGEGGVRLPYRRDELLEQYRVLVLARHLEDHGKQ